MPEKLRKLSRKIVPLFKDPDESDDRQSELTDGEKGHGKLVRKYIDNLDMDFYAGRASEKGHQTSIVTLRIPEDVAKDISIMLATGKTRFRDKSEFIRTMIYIGMNYYAKTVGGKFREHNAARDAIDLSKERERERQSIKGAIEGFNNQFDLISSLEGDEELHKFIKQFVELVFKGGKQDTRERLTKAVSDKLLLNGIDPSDYFDVKKKD